MKHHVIAEKFTLPIFSFVSHGRWVFFPAGDENFLKLQHTPNIYYRLLFAKTFSSTFRWEAFFSRLLNRDTRTSHQRLLIFFYLPFRSEPLEESLWSVMRFPPAKHFLLVLFEWALKLMSYEFFLFHVCLLICCERRPVQSSDLHRKENRWKSR